MSEVKHPSTIINVQGDTIPYRECAYIERLQDATESLAIWGATSPGGRYQYAISGRNGSRKHPSTIRGSKFNFTVPDTAKISSIIVEYRYRKMQYSSPIGQTAHGSFGNPTIRINPFNLQKEGNAPPRNNLQTYQVRFDNLNIRGSDVKKDSFNVEFDLPANTSTNPCYIQIQYLRVFLEFESENYSVSCSITEEELYYGQIGSVVCKTTETSGLGGNKTVLLDVDIPDGLSLVDKPDWFDFDGTLHQKLVNGVGVTTIKISPSNQYVRGMKEVVMTNPANGYTSKDQVNIKTIPLEVWDFYLNNREIEISSDDEKHYTYLMITLQTLFPRDATLKFDYGGLTANKSSTITITEDEWVEDDSGNWIVDFTIQLYGTDLGLHTISMTSDEFYGVYTESVQVNLPETAIPYYTGFYLQDFSYQNMEDGKKYIFSCLARIINTDEIIEGQKNCRVGLRNGATEVYSNKLSQIGEWEELKIEFIYDAENPIFISCFGNYIEAGDGDIDYGNFCLVDYERYNGYEYPALAFTPPQYLIRNSEYASCLLEPPERIITTKHFFQGFNWQGLDTSQAVLIHGVEVTGEISSETPINLILGFGTTDISENDYYRDSVHVTEEDTTFKFGGKFKTLGQEFYELQENMSKWRFWLQFDHTSGDNTPNNLNVKNIQVKIYYTIGSEQECDFYIDGTDARYLLISLNPETEIPRGAQYDSETYKVEGADGEYPVRINIEQKEIGLKFFVYGDDFEDSTELLNYITEFLYPLRNNLDDPILKSISFYFDREHCYDYYIEDEIEAEAVVGGYECEVTLLIPDGLKRTTEKVHRSFTGDTFSIGKIKPEIEFIKQTNSEEDNFIEIVEEFSGQKLRLTGEFIENLEDGTKLKLDCKNKKAYYKLYDEWFLLDSNFISINSQWFILNGTFSFEYCTNCKVTDLYYYEYSG